MASKEMKNVSFRGANFEEWVLKAEAAMKGKKLETLRTDTYENIVLKPLYLPEDGNHISDYPGFDDYRRGYTTLGYVSGSWKVAQKIAYNSVKDLRGKLTDALAKGQTAISFEGKEELFFSQEEFVCLMHEFSNSYPLAIHAKEWQNSILAVLIDLVRKDTNVKEVVGYIARDPLAAMAEAGFIPKDVDLLFKQWGLDIKLASKELPNLRTIMIDASVYHNAGANAVQELAIAIGTGVFYVEKLLETGMPIEEIIDKMIFNFSVGSNFFMETAKFRAARLLWGKVAEAYGVSSDKLRMEISAETSLFTKSIYDPHVNMLRAGNEAFAAVLGNVQYLNVHAFDSLTSASVLGDRLARSTQLILKEEVYLQQVIDPAGGSWYVESLTEELSQKAWDLFLSIDHQGGILETLLSNSLQEQIVLVRNKRVKDVNNRKLHIVGTNVYANLEEKAPGFEMAQEIQNVVDESLETFVRVLKDHKNILELSSKKVSRAQGVKIDKLSKERLSSQFEELRRKAQALAERKGDAPSVGLICMGDLKDYKPRADFIRSFLSAGGVKAPTSEGNLTAKASMNFIELSKTTHFCLCGSDEQYKDKGLSVLKALKTAYPHFTFYLAGLPEESQQQEWILNGLHNFIHLKSDCYDTLFKLLSEMEMEAYEN